MFTSRSETLVVAVEQLCGNTGDATTLFSAYWNDEPAKRSGVARNVFVEAVEDRADHRARRRRARGIEAAVDAGRIVAQIDVDHRLFRIDLDVTLSVEPSGRMPSSGSERPVLAIRAFGSLRIDSMARRSE